MKKAVGISAVKEMSSRKTAGSIKEGKPHVAECLSLFLVAVFASWIYEPRNFNRRSLYYELHKLWNYGIGIRRER
jgi:hypothetical protein